MGTSDPERLHRPDTTANDRATPTMRKLTPKVTCANPQNRPKIRGRNSALDGTSANTRSSPGTITSARVHGTMKIPTTEKTIQRFSHFHVRESFMGMANPPLKAPLTRMTIMPNQK